MGTLCQTVETNQKYIVEKMTGLIFYIEIGSENQYLLSYNNYSECWKAPITLREEIFAELNFAEFIFVFLPLIRKNKFRKSQQKSLIRKNKFRKIS